MDNVNDLSLTFKNKLLLVKIFSKISENNLKKVKSKDIRNIFIFDPMYKMIRDIYYKNNVKLLPCGVFFGRTTVSPDGDYYPCHRFVNLDNFKIGNVREKYNEEKAQALLGNYIANQKKSSTCWVRNLCSKGCYYAIADKEKGTLNMPLESDCEVTKLTFKLALYLIIKYRNILDEYFKINAHLGV